jgi:hypothetical protein
MANIQINNSSFSGRSISVINNRVFIDGKDVTPDAKEINITVEGSMEDLTVDYCNSLNINGDTRNIKTQSGDVRVKGDVSGNVQTMSGDVDCGTIGGSVTTMSGDITRR